MRLLQSHYPPYHSVHELPCKFAGSLLRTLHQLTTTRSRFGLVLMPAMATETKVPDGNPARVVVLFSYIRVKARPEYG